MREININIIEECISRLLNILTKGEHIAKILDFLKSLIINLSGELKTNVVLSIRDVVNFLLKNQTIYNFSKDEVSEMNLIISIIKYKFDNAQISFSPLLHEESVDVNNNNIITQKITY